MRSTLAVIILMLCSTSLKAQQSYSLEASFWHNRVSTKDSLYTQNYDLSEHGGSIPLHLGVDDLRFLDSVATAFGFWDLPDTIRERPLESINGVVFGDAMLPPSERADLEFRTPTKQKHVVVVSWPADTRLRLRLQNFETAINWVIQQQPYYNTLRVYDIRR